MKQGKQTQPSYISKRITLRNIYIKYPYKTRDINKPTLPYFPKNEITDTKYSLPYNSWKKILFTYFSLCILYLKNGFILELPNKMGLLQILKYKSKKVDFSETTKGKVVYYVNHLTDGYSPILKWIRKRNFGVNFLWSSIWKINFVPKVWEEISNFIEEEGIHNYNNIYEQSNNY